MTTFRALFVVILTLGIVWAVLALMQDDEPENGRSDVDRGNDKAVCDAALIALARGDLERLKPLMTDEGWSQFDREMRLLRAGLGKPDADPQVQTLIATAVEKLGEADARVAIDAAQVGDISNTWALLLKLYPMDDPPRGAGIYMDPKRPDERTWYYHGPTGVRRPVNMVRRSGIWYVNAIGLL